MLFVAALLLPVLVLLLIAVDRIEDWLAGTDPDPSDHPRAHRHLRLIPGRASQNAARAQPDLPEQRSDAA
ncbi:hypothetical protein AB0E27_28235 [Streptomyces sparsogenes]|uniref:hypothetical protein n=1 Tax=Streptomyces sparsogenes TaxID=67365 RepID=UPI0033D9C269